MKIHLYQMSLFLTVLVVLCMVSYSLRGDICHLCHCKKEKLFCRSVLVGELLESPSYRTKQLGRFKYLDFKWSSIQDFHLDVVSKVFPNATVLNIKNAFNIECTSLLDFIHNSSFRFKIETDCFNDETDEVKAENITDLKQNYKASVIFHLVIVPISSGVVMLFALLVIYLLVQKLRTCPRPHFVSLI